MEESNKLTSKKFWSNNWKNIKLPARYFYNDYSHILIAKLIEKFLNKQYENFLEIGGCPGQWADYFFTKHKMICDSMDYDAENIVLTEKNYTTLGITGRAFLGDITDSSFNPMEKYDIVLSDGLIEHFVDSSEVFRNHIKFLKSGGLLIIGVPNIKKSWFYDYFAKKDKVGYPGYRHIDKDELVRHAKNNKLKILFCDYIGVFNIGLVHSYTLSKILAKLFVVINLVSNKFLKMFKIKKESKTLSPYICLIAKK